MAQESVGLDSRDPKASQRPSTGSGPQGFIGDTAFLQCSWGSGPQLFRAPSPDLETSVKRP